MDVMARNHRALSWLIAVVLAGCGTAHARSGYGRMAGVVLDSAGTPQLGATVWVSTEDAADHTVTQLLTDQHGAFSDARLRSGSYSVRVSLAGFLPTLEQHVEVTPNLTTLLKIELGTVFDSLNSLRRQPAQPTEPDDWTWVLRTATATRPILQWTDIDTNGAANSAEARVDRPRVLVEMTGGSLHPASPSSLVNAPGTEVSFDQSLGSMGHLLMAGQMSYEHTASGGLATIWMPSGDPNVGPVTTLVVRETDLGTSGLVFRGVRLDHSEQLKLGDRVRLSVGAEYIMEGFNTQVRSLRPRAELDAQLSPNWEATVLMATDSPDSNPFRPGALGAALDALDSMPDVLFRSGQPVLENDWHQEMRITRKLDGKGSVEAAVFHDAAQHQAVFGIGAAPDAGVFQDPFSDAFVFDGGNSSSWGARLGYQEKINDHLEVTAVYAYGGALAPTYDSGADVTLRGSLAERYRHSLAARVSSKVPRINTEVAASYKWVSGSALTPVDCYGEAAYELDPNFSLSVRQPIPTFLLNGHWVAMADFGNLLAQGYIPIAGPDGVVTLAPVVRSFRGGLSFQF
jgi:hypothetical protein